MRGCKMKHICIPFSKIYTTIIVVDFVKTPFRWLSHFNFVLRNIRMFMLTATAEKITKYFDIADGIFLEK